MADTGARDERPLVDSVLLIDGDNDPHLPPDFVIGERTLVRVFLRTGAKMPRALERRLAGLPFCVAVVSPQTGGNAADFVMSLHAGTLHATLPMHLPFTIVTADKSLSVACQELQRLGRQAVLWSSHPKQRGRRVSRNASAAAPVGNASAAVAAADKPARARRGRRRGGRGRSTAAPAPAAPVARAEQPPRMLSESASDALTAASAAYAARLARIKDGPSRLKSLLNDIRNRVPGHAPEAVLEELKRVHGVLVDERGVVRYAHSAVLPSESSGS